MSARGAPFARSLCTAGLAVALFAAGFALADRFQLTHGVLYRAAANDMASAISNLLWLATQALALLAAIALLGRRAFAAAMALAGASVLVNLTYGQTLNDVVDAGKLAWVAAEARRGGDAAAEFAGPFLLASLQTIIAIGLFIAARRVLRSIDWIPRGRVANAAGAFLLVLPSVLSGVADLGPRAAERNVYSAAAAIALAEPPPPRGRVDLRPSNAGAPRHIVWLVDESVAYAPFARLIGPQLAGIDHVDFGVAASLGHCSAPSNLALRSGVDVRHASPRMDLRTTPSIWGYARRAGYRTILIDGQTGGAPQNLLLPPEIALIDELRSSAGGIDTDRAIARELNRQVRSRVPTFTYVVLRGVHFQYSDHYPAGAVRPDSPVMRHYEAALAHSKKGFFEALLDGVDRDSVAVVYTSDHGQNLAAGSLPHCSREAVPDEFLVPLVTFLPDRLAARYPGSGSPGRSASQIFPATLIWMGYDREVVERRYDHDLDTPTARYVRFDRNVIPLSPGDEIGIATDFAPPPQYEGLAWQDVHDRRPGGS